MTSSNKILPAMLALSFFASGCVYYPRKIEQYDSGCDVQVKKLTLAKNQSAIGCGTDLCLINLGVAVTSAVVSESIIAVGNTVYWLEKKGKCLGKSKPEQ